MIRRLLLIAAILAALTVSVILWGADMTTFLVFVALFAWGLVRYTFDRRT